MKCVLGPAHGQHIVPPKVYQELDFINVSVAAKLTKKNPEDAIESPITNHKYQIRSTQTAVYVGD